MIPEGRHSAIISLKVLFHGENGGGCCKHGKIDRVIYKLQQLNFSSWINIIFLSKTSKQPTNQPTPPKTQKKNTQ